jgi:uncharacterized protein (DUF433 family)
MEPTLATNPNPTSSQPVRSLSQEHIVSTPDTCGGKPRINGTRIRVKDIVLWHERMGMSPEEIVSEWPHLTLGDVYAALAYYDDNRQQIDAEMKAEEAFAAELEDKTSLTARRPVERDAADDTLSSR